MKTAIALGDPTVYGGGRLILVINALVRVVLDMFLVIFRAEIAELDDEYFSLAPKLRDEAIRDFGCVEFFAVSENGYEVALSYWNSQEEISNWHEHNLHKYAQSMGYKKWYSMVRVEIANIVRSYSR